MGYICCLVDGRLLWGGWEFVVGVGIDVGWGDFSVGVGIDVGWGEFAVGVGIPVW